MKSFRSNTVNLALEKGFETFLNAMKAYRKRNKGDGDAPILD